LPTCADFNSCTNACTANANSNSTNSNGDAANIYAALDSHTNSYFADSNGDRIANSHTTSWHRRRTAGKYGKEFPLASS
jgi:hypothetical protein